MKHRAFVAVDGPSIAASKYFLRSRHRADLTKPTMVNEINEQYAYTRWCLQNNFDPEDTASAVAYEGDVGWLYLDEKEDHR